MRRSHVFATAGAVALIGSALAGTVASAAPSHNRSPLHLVGQRPALTSSSTSERSALPSPGDITAGTELKSPEVEARENSPQGGSNVLNGNIRPPSAASVPVTQNSARCRQLVRGFESLRQSILRRRQRLLGRAPDQGLCVGDNYVFEIVNSVVQVYTKSGSPLIAGNQGVPGWPVGRSDPQRVLRSAPGIRSPRWPLRAVHVRHLLPLRRLDAAVVRRRRPTSTKTRAPVTSPARPGLAGGQRLGESTG